MKRAIYSGVILLAVSLTTVAPLSAARQDENTSNMRDEIRPIAAVRDDLRQNVEDKRAEIRSKIEAKRAEIAEKLDSKRLDVCEKREGRINDIIDRSVTQSQKHLEVFEKIEERVKTFYTDKNLNVENYETLLATVDEKHTSAVAQIEAAQQTDFNCEDAASTRPTGVIKDVVNAKNDAIKEYRTALKDLIVAIKGASTGQESTETTETTETETGTGEAN